MTNTKELDFSNEFMEKVIKWTLTGLTLYYRDSDLDKEIINKYTIGKVFRAPTFVDVSSVAGKPTKNCRFVFASSKSAPLFKMNPKTEKWKLHTINCNSTFKILDVYEQNGTTQIFLLHIPYNGRHIFENTRLVINEENIEDKLIGTARKSFESKFNFKSIPQFEEKEWLERVSFPIGLNMENNFYPMKPKGPLLEDAKPLFQAIRSMTNDLTYLNEIRDL